VKTVAKQDAPPVSARGGVLAAGEIRALLDGSSDVETFHKLGQPPALPRTAVLSPPLTPEYDKTANAKSSSNDIAVELAKISSAKEEARFRHTLLKARVKFVGQVKSAIPTHAAAQDIKVKEFCGYDRRLEWTESEFWAWWEQQEGNNNNSNNNNNNNNTDSSTNPAKPELEEKSKAEEKEEEDSPLICNRKRCLRHTDWPKLALDALRAEISANSDRMRGLEGEERKLREQALLRSVGGRKGEGWVERHDVHGEGGDGKEKEGRREVEGEGVGIGEDGEGKEGKVEAGGVVEKDLETPAVEGEGEGEAFHAASSSQKVEDNAASELAMPDVAAEQGTRDATMVES
jgi:COMPASS component SPP1